LLLVALMLDPSQPIHDRCSFAGPTMIIQIELQRGHILDAQ
jgi:hypothetical protein